MAGKQYVDLILKKIPLPLLLVAPSKGDWTIVSVNQSYLNISGQKEDEIKDKSFFDIFQDNDDPDTQTALKNLIDDAIISGSSFRVELKFNTRQAGYGIYRDVEITPVLDGAGIAEFLICSLMNASTAENDLNLLMDNTEESFIQVGRDLQILNYNSKFKDDLKTYFNREVYKGDNILKYALPNHEEMLEGVYKKVFKGETVEYEIEVRLKGEVLTKRVNYKPIYEPDKGVHSVFVTSRDVTNEKRSRAANEFERRDKEALINSTEDMIWSLSKSLKLVAANDAFIKNLKNLTGKTFEKGDEILATPYFSDEQCKYWGDLYAKVFDGARLVVQSEDQGNDKQIWFETSLNPIYKEKDIVGIACFAKNITEGKHAQHQLIQANKRLNAAQKLAKVGYWEVTLKSGKLYWSDEVYAIWNTEAESFELNADTLVHTIHPDDLKEFDAQRENAIENKQGFSFEHRIILPGGDIKWVHETGNVIIKDGVVVGFEGTVQDVTESKLAEEALNQSNERYKYATRATYDAIWDWDLITDNIYWGEGFEMIFGHKIKDLQPDTSSWTDHIHAADRERVMSGIYGVIESSQNSWSDEYWYLKANGDYAYVHDKGIVIRDEKNIAVRMIGAMHDLTQQKEEEKQLRLLESVITHSNDAIMITEAEPIDETGPRIVFVNEAFLRMTGYSPEEIIGKTPRMLQGPKTNRKELDKLRRALEKWKPVQVEVVNYKKNGEEFWIHISVVPIADGNGFYTHWIAIQRDVTERRNYVEMLERQNTALKDIAWTQSHVVRAPLARLMGLVNIMELDPENEQNRKELLGYISDSANELDKIIRSIINKASKIKPADIN